MPRKVAYVQAILCHTGELSMSEVILLVILKEREDVTGN